MVDSESVHFDSFKNSELRTQNSENNLFNPNITFRISLNKYIKLNII